MVSIYNEFHFLLLLSMNTSTRRTERTRRTKCLESSISIQVSNSGISSLTKKIPIPSSNSTTAVRFTHSYVINLFIGSKFQVTSWSQTLHPACWINFSAFLTILLLCFADKKEKSYSCDLNTLITRRSVEHMTSALMALG